MDTPSTHPRFDTLSALMHRLARPLSPQPTGETSTQASLDNIQAVLFDVYGTLLISGSGDIGIAQADSKTEALLETFKHFDLTLTGPANQALDLFYQIIKDHQQALKQTGTLWPDVEIRDVWRDCFSTFQQRGWTNDFSITADFVEEWAIAFEMRVNPTWPMPGFPEILQTLLNRDLQLGIISNAQFFTPLLIETFCKQSLDQLGFDSTLCFYSYAEKNAKPGQHLYTLARQALEKKNISPQQVLYVGNDRRNDVLPASQVGFRTSLFAGDGRSLRWRNDDDLCGNVQPDLITAQLGDLEFQLASSR